MLAGLERPESGSIYYNDEDISSVDQKVRQRFLKEDIGLIFQTPSLLNELSVLENVMIKGLISHQIYRPASKKALLLLEKVGLGHKAHCRPNQLSGGEQQRVAVARALFTEPAFIFADEPTAHLDDTNTGSIIDLLLDCQREWHMGLILASHDLEVADRLQVLLRLEKGALLEISRKTSQVKFPPRISDAQLEIF